MARSLRVLQVFDLPYALKRGHDYTEEFKDRENFAAENDVYRALLDNGYEARPLGLFDDVRPLLDDVEEFKPDVIFNMVETFGEVTGWDKNIAALLELMLADGELKAKVSIEVAGASKSAIEKIEKAGGSVKLLAAAAE